MGSIGRQAARRRSGEAKWMATRSLGSVWVADEGKGIFAFGYLPGKRGLHALVRLLLRSPGGLSQHNHRESRSTFLAFLSGRPASCVAPALHKPISNFSR